MASDEIADLHASVLRDEITAFFTGMHGTVVDCTLGMGGHTEALLETNDDIRIIGIDQDESAIRLATERLKAFGERFTAIHSNFSQLEVVLDKAGFGKVQGVIADLGVSSLQFDSSERGFSFRYDAPLDMRMDRDPHRRTAAELLRDLDAENIANILYELGEERYSRRIARRIVERRESGDPVTTTFDLADLVRNSVPWNKKDKIHPATRTFQALRIAVNDEIGILENFLDTAIDRLDGGGRLAVISFHSLEDRIVKNVFRRSSGKCECSPRIPVCVCGAVKKVKILTKRPITPGPIELAANPRARSAKLRAVEHLPNEFYS